ncbi:MAG: hypothetical protein IJ740_09700 [Ruminococcus sp.]|nr:hypothetical protein [Ruminococcus sp.]
MNISLASSFPPEVVFAVETTCVLLPDELLLDDPENDESDEDEVLDDAVEPELEVLSLTVTPPELFVLPELLDELP